MFMNDHEFTQGSHYKCDSEFISDLIDSYSFFAHCVKPYIKKLAISRCLRRIDGVERIVFFKSVDGSYD